MGDKKNKEQAVGCPVGKFFTQLDDVIGKKSKFFEHMTRSRIEFLKGIRSLLDERISYYETKGSKKTAGKMTKIKVD